MRLEGFGGARRKTKKDMSLTTTPILSDGSPTPHVVAADCKRNMGLVGGGEEPTTDSRSSRSLAWGVVLQQHAVAPLAKKMLGPHIASRTSNGVRPRVITPVITTRRET